MSAKTLTFSKEKETKNTVRYNEDPSTEHSPVIGTLYVQKWYAGSAQKLTVTIEPS